MKIRNPENPWSDDEIPALWRLWNEGHSTRIIGEKMGRSKNSIVGKAHRLAFPARPSPLTREYNEARSRTERSRTQRETSKRTVAEIVASIRTSACNVRVIIAESRGPSGPCARTPRLPSPPPQVMHALAHMPIPVHVRAPTMEALMLPPVAVTSHQAIWWGAQKGIPGPMLDLVAINHKRAAAGLAPFVVEQLPVRRFG